MSVPGSSRSVSEETFWDKILDNDDLNEVLFKDAQEDLSPAKTHFSIPGAFMSSVFGHIGALASGSLVQDIGHAAGVIQDVANHAVVAPFAERVALLENSKNDLSDRVAACRRKAVGPSQEPWKKEVVEFSQTVRPVSEVGADDNSLPTIASPKQAKEYDPSIAKGETDAVLDKLICNFSTWAIIGLIHNSGFLGGPRTGVDFADVAGLIGRTEDAEDPGKAALELYIDHCALKKGWTGINKIIRTKWMKIAYWFLSGNVPGIIEKAFKGILGEIRKSTDGSGKIESVFEHLIGHLEGFFKEYNKPEASHSEVLPLERIAPSTAEWLLGRLNALLGGKKETPLEELSLEDLCKGIAPYLISEFIPRLTLCEERFKTIPILRSLGFIWRFILDPMIDQTIRLALGRALPGLLKTGAEGLENAITGNGDNSNATAGKPAINYGLANPILKFINEKLAEFIVILHEPKFETDEPVPEAIKGKLEGVINELMALAKGKLSGNTKTQEGLRDGLIGGGYQLMKFWQREQEILLKSVLELTTSSLFSKGSSNALPGEEEQKYKELLEEQQAIVIQISNRIIDVEVKKTAVGAPATQINHHWFLQHRKIKSYLEEGLADVIGLQSALQKATADLNAETPQYDEFDAALNKHWIFWEGFLLLMAEATKAQYPEQSKEMLMKEFYPLCEFAKQQLELVAQLQDERVLGTKHEEIKKLFTREYQHLCEKDERNRPIMNGPVISPENMNPKRMQELLNQIAVLFPSGNARPSEVIVLQAWISKMKDLQEMAKAIQALEIKLATRYQRDVEVQLERKHEDLKLEKLKLLRTIDPSRGLDRVALGSFEDFLGEFRSWVRKQALGYKTRAKQNVEGLLAGTQDLTDQNADLLVRVREKEAVELRNVLEERADEAAAWFAREPQHPSFREDIVGAFTSRISTVVFKKLPALNPVDRMFKAPLMKDFKAVLAGVRPLIIAEKGSQAEGAHQKRNLYIWVERLALQETLRYYRTRPAQE